MKKKKRRYKAPGKFFRKGLSLLELTRMFPDDETAEKWLIQARWPNGVRCPKCESDNIQERVTRKPQPFRCRSCRRDFSVKTDTLMHNSPLGCQIWVLAIYLMTTSLKGVSSMKLHRDLGITQKTAWYLGHRIRENFADANGEFSGPVEVDEAYLGGKRRNMPASKRKHLTGRGPAGKTAVVGAKDRATNQVRASVVQETNKRTLQGFVRDRVQPGARLYTDGTQVYRSFPNQEGVRHSVGEFVRGQAHTNGVESFWSLLKRGYVGTFHKLSPKHLQRYVDEFSGRHNIRTRDTLDQMRCVLRNMVGKRLRYQDLVA